MGRRPDRDIGRLALEALLRTAPFLSTVLLTASLANAALAWAEDAAERAGEGPSAFIQGAVFRTVSEQKLNSDAPRQDQVKWRLARTPPG